MFKMMWAALVLAIAAIAIAAAVIGVIQTQRTTLTRSGASDEARLDAKGLHLALALLPASAPIAVSFGTTAWKVHGEERCGFFPGTLTRTFNGPMAVLPAHWPQPKTPIRKVSDLTKYLKDQAPPFWTVKVPGIFVVPKAADGTAKTDLGAIWPGNVVMFFPEGGAAEIASTKLYLECGMPTKW